MHRHKSSGWFVLVSMMLISISLSGCGFRSNNHSLGVGETIAFEIEGKEYETWEAYVTPGTTYEVAIRVVDTNLADVELETADITIADRHGQTIVGSESPYGSSNIVFTPQDSIVLVRITSPGIVSEDFRGDYVLVLKEIDNSK